MSPHPADDRLITFSQGRSDPVEVAAIEDHLRGCPSCLDRVEAAGGGPVVAGLRSDAGSGEPAWVETSPDSALGETIVHQAAGDCPAALGGYRIERLLGRGGMGSVYLAHDDRLGRAVALKTMRVDIASRPGSAERFLREARSAALVEHDFVVPIWQVGEDDGVPFIAMPLLKGESLAERLARTPKPPAGMILKVGIEVAEGLAAAHARGIIHRDVKPENIWLEADDDRADTPASPWGFRRCKLLDFGLARPSDESVGLTTPGLTIGSPSFMSPEQARGQTVDVRTDLFSLGAVLYRMTTGAPPFRGPNVTAVLAALLTDEPAPPALPPGAPRGLSALILRLLAKSPADRPGSAREVAAALRGLATRTTAAHSGGRARHFRRSAAVVIALALLTGVVATAVSEWPRRPVKTRANTTAASTTLSTSRAADPTPAPPAAVPAVRHALEFNGRSSSVTFPTLTWPETPPMTIEVWAEAETVHRPSVIFALGGRFESALYVSPKNWFLVDSNLSGNFLDTPFQPGLAHMAYVVDGGEGRYYFDGEKVAQAPWTAETAGRPVGSAHAWMGAVTDSPSDPAVLYHFRGRIFEARVSRVARYTSDFRPARRFEPDPDTLALYHFQEGRGDVLTDSSGHGHDGQIAHARWVTVAAE